MNKTETQTDERITALEMKIAWLEDFVQQIQQVAVEQAQTINRIQKENKLIAEKNARNVRLS